MVIVLWYSSCDVHLLTFIFQYCSSSNIVHLPVFIFWHSSSNVHLSMFIFKRSWRRIKENQQEINQIMHLNNVTVDNKRQQQASIGPQAAKLENFLSPWLNHLGFIVNARGGGAQIKKSFWKLSKIEIMNLPSKAISELSPITPCKEQIFNQSHNKEGEYALGPGFPLLYNINKLTIYSRYTFSFKSHKNSVQW